MTLFTSNFAFSMSLSLLFAKRFSLQISNNVIISTLTVCGNKNLFENFLRFFLLNYKTIFFLLELLIQKNEI